MRRITKLDGDDRDQGVQSANQTAVSRPPLGETFTCLGDVARSVVLRIKGGLPRIALAPTAWEEEDRDQL